MKIIFTSLGVRTINFHEELESEAEDNLIDLQGERVKEKQIRFLCSVSNEKIFELQQNQLLNISKTAHKKKENSVLIELFSNYMPNHEQQQPLQCQIFI